MLLDVAEAMLLEKTNRRFVLGIRIDDDDAHPLLLHAALDLAEQFESDLAFLHFRAHPEPDQVAVFPGRMMFFDRGAEGEADCRLIFGLGHQAQLVVRVEHRGDFILVPGPVKRGRIFSGKNFFADMKDLGEIIDGHAADADPVLTRRDGFFSFRIFFGHGLLVTGG